jgi:adenylate kinase
MRVIITGTPGCGKSAVAAELSRLMGLRLVDIKRIARRDGLVSRSGEVDVKRLSSSLAYLRREDGFVAEGHLACEIRLPHDAVVVLRCEPEALRRRLSRRGYGKRKLEENVMAEMLDYCTQRVEKVYGVRPLELDTSSRTPRQSALEITGAIKHKKKKIDTVDYSSALIRSARRGEG